MKSVDVCPNPLYNRKSRVEQNDINYSEVAQW